MNIKNVGTGSRKVVEFYNIFSDYSPSIHLAAQRKHFGGNVNLVGH